MRFTRSAIILLVAAACSNNLDTPDKDDSTPEDRDGDGYDETVDCDEKAKVVSGGVDELNSFVVNDCGKGV